MIDCDKICKSVRTSIMHTLFRGARSGLGVVRGRGLRTDVGLDAREHQ